MSVAPFGRRTRIKEPRILGSSDECRGTFMEEHQAQLEVSHVAEPVSLPFEYVDLVVEPLQRAGGDALVEIAQQPLPVLVQVVGQRLCIFAFLGVKDLAGLQIDRDGHVLRGLKNSPHWWFSDFGEIF
jgi:hypothetical protein